MPSLTPKIAADNSALGRRMDRLLRHDPEIARLTKKILWLQGRLRARVDDRTWRLFLRLESAVSDRTVDTDYLLTRWAFTEGRRCSSRR
jgi:predicted RNA polymerase sigma factor